MSTLVWSKLLNLLPYTFAHADPDGVHKNVKFTGNVSIREHDLWTGALINNSGARHSDIQTKYNTVTT